MAENILKRMQTGNVFLTGERGVGKSTAIARFLAEAGPLRPSGFATFFDGDRVCIAPYADRAARAVVAVRDPAAMTMDVYADVFDTVGAGILRAAREGAQADTGLILMDELGFMEADALAFQAEVFRCLDAPAPVLGVLKQSLPPGEAGFSARSAFLDWIRAREDVRVIVVTRENRDGVPALLKKITL
ncbi:MAG: nucleoside-triphosphatase [Clostridiales Family XIII bacterium]|jgi:nucleoside-triphosphatase|nr:nucleoside-triphosphatase [Clostridiales Family XIII bacterium]